MTPEQVAELRVMQARARAGVLTAEERVRYLEARRGLEAALNAAQLLLAPASARARQAFRVVCSLEIELSFADRPVRKQTANFSAGGFSVPLDKPCERGAWVPFALWLGGDAEPIRGQASCRGTFRLGDSCRASFEFAELPPEARARIELEMVDLQLELLWPSPRLSP